ncbi:MAG: hypothetical protein N2376_03345 [Clostridia bacterium]|nr:hypothetical protein [Clostridia bacterium]
MNDQVILSLETYNQLLDTIRNLREDLASIFKATTIGQYAYIQLNEKGAEIVNTMSAKFSKTHEVRNIASGAIIECFNSKKEELTDVNDTIPD